MPDDRFRPGCFGSPLCYKKGHAVCTLCPFSAECAPIAEKRLATLQARYGVTTKTVKAEPVKPVVKRKPTKLELVANALRAGKNPFNEKAAGQQSWWLVCEVLLRKPDKAGFTAIAILIARLLNVIIGKAADHLRAILTQLMQSGAVIKTGDLYAIR